MNERDLNNADMNASKFNAEDLALLDALQDVQIPDGLEARLRTAVLAEPTVSQPHRESSKSRSNGRRFSRRSWLVSAASLAGVSAVGGLAYSRRTLEIAEATNAVNNAWLTEKWSKVWQSMSTAPLSPPHELLRPRCWQYLETELADETIVFDLTLPGRPPAVLFSAKMWRDISAFPTKPESPQNQSGPWSRITAWRQNRVLHVLASIGTNRDYDELFVSKGTIPLA